MFRRITGIFQRYLARHLILSRPGPVLLDASGSFVAKVEEITLTAARIRVTCLSEVEELWLEDGLGYQTCLLPVGADSSTPLHSGTLRLVAPVSGTVSVRLPVPSTLHRKVAAAKLFPKFMSSVLMAAPDIIKWSRTGDLRLRPKIRKVLGLSLDPQIADLDPSLFDQPEEDAPAGRGTWISMVLPVFNAFDLLPEVLNRIFNHTDLPWHMIVIEDASTDPRVRPWLRDRLADLPEGQVTLIENDTNMGFIRSVNIGFSAAKGKGDVTVLINSDAFVPTGWASRIVAPILANPHVASVTPMSNDAEILTVPTICVPNTLRPGQGDAIDKVAAGFNPNACTAELPTGVGYCMAISNQWLAKVPEFDPVFGRGYGEEVDWCQKVIAIGGIHIGLPGLFVEHRGGASFGLAEKQQRIAAGNRIVRQRYPHFPIAAETFIVDDPLATPRFALAIAWAASRTGRSLPVYIAHSLGGGAEIWLKREIGKITSANDAGAAMVIRLGGRRRWRLELYLPQAATLTTETDDVGLVAKLLLPARCNLIYSCAVGDADPFSLPSVIAKLKREDDGLEILFHDFYPLSPSYTLLDQDGQFRGVPLKGNHDPAHQTTRPDGQRVSLDDWRDAWGELLAEADQLTVFSTDSRNHVVSAWPEFADKVQTKPHALHTQVQAVERPANDHPLAVGVLGNIGLQKGLVIVDRLAVAAAGSPRIVVVGNTDPAYSLSASIAVHGEYDLADIPTLVRTYNIGAWLIPSIWPETFSYTTHEALATKLPVFGFSLGAQAEALRAHPNGRLVELAEVDVMVQSLLCDLRATLDQGK
jgi:GT2 family glycosyltransferase